jgi:SAM-dependent methyltransferase
MTLFSKLLDLLNKSQMSDAESNKGGISKKIESRENILFSLFDSNGVGLEIGPSFNPLLPKAKGFKVDILDHLTEIDLKKKYAGAPNVNFDLIEKVDYVSSGGSIHSLIARNEYYDFIVASHVIEHTTDLLGFLIDCEKLLKPNGILVLAVPDHRFSFDCLRPVTTTGQVLQANLEKCQTHNPGKVFDEIAYNCLRDGALAWPRNVEGKLNFFATLDQAKTAFKELSKENIFRDIHAWQFTPSSFRLILSDLVNIGAINMGEKSFIDIEAGEFYVALSRSARGCTIPRLVLAQQSILEERSISVM